MVTSRDASGYVYWAPSVMVKLAVSGPKTRITAAALKRQRNSRSPPRLQAALIFPAGADTDVSA
jgi:hypothetical protein